MSSNLNFNDMKTAHSNAAESSGFRPRENAIVYDEDFNGFVLYDDEEEESDVEWYSPEEEEEESE